MYRFAPSPTGDMHIGNLRAAIFNYICSLQDKSGFILRIEDTDTARNIEGKDQEIIEILKRFGIKWQSLYYQSKNLKFHQQFAAKLLAEKKAFCCFCSEEELEAKKQAAKDAGEAYALKSPITRWNLPTRSRVVSHLSRKTSTVSSSCARTRRLHITSPAPATI